MTEERKAPAIRFKEFLDDVWKKRKLGDLGSVEMCKRIFKEETSEDFEIPFFKIGTFGGKADTYITRKKFEEYKAKYPYPNKGDLLISASGSIGRVVEYSGQEEYYQDSNIVWLNHSGKIENSFLKQFYSIVTWSGIEGTTIKRLYNKNILETKISLPTPPEQRAIGSFFQDLDKLITLQQRKLEVLKEQKKTYLKLLSPAKGQKKPARRFAGFEDEWKEVKVSDIFRVTRGQVLATTEISEEKTDTHKYPVYSSQTKNEGLLGYYDKYLFETAITWTTDGANAGTVNYREGKFYSTNVNGVLLSDEGFANKVIAEILNKEAWKYVSKVGNPKLMNNVMSEISLVIPNDFREISILSSLFQDLDKFIALQQRRLDKLQNMKKALLEQMMM